MSTDGREHPRAPLATAVELELPDGATLRGTTVNASRAGIEVECDRATRDRIFPAGEPPTPADRPALRVRLRLPPGGGEVLEANAVGVTSRRVAEARYRLGIQFRKLEPQDFRRLEQLIYQAGRSR